MWSFWAVMPALRSWMRYKYNVFSNSVWLAASYFCRAVSSGTVIRRVEQVQFGRTYRVREDSESGYVVELKREDTFVKAVAFRLHYAEESDFEMSNYYTSSYPGSPFVTRMMCTLPTFEGRYTIRDNLFKKEYNGKTSQMFLNADTVQNILETYFGVVLTVDMNNYIRGYLERV